MSINSWRTLLLAMLCSAAAGCADRVSELAAQLDDPDVNVRREAVFKLGDVLEPMTDIKVRFRWNQNIPASGRLIGAFIKAAGNSDDEVRMAGMGALGRIGPPASDAMPLLENALDDPNPKVRTSAAWAIFRIDPKNPKFVHVLSTAVREGNGRTLWLGDFGADAAWAVPALVDLLSNSSAQLRALAAQTLGKIGPAAATAKPALERATHDANPTVRSAAQQAIERIDGKADAGERKAG